MDQWQEFVYIFKPKRDNYMSGMTADEKAVMELQRAHCQRMVATGEYVLANVSLNGAYGICVFQAASPEDAYRIFGQDPAVKAGVVYAELHAGVTTYAPASREEKSLLYTRG